MAESITATEYNQLAGQETKSEIIFGGEKRNMAVGIAMFGAGFGAYITGLTHSFFAQAIATTFILWGILLLYNDLLLTTRRLTITDAGLKIDVPMRLWSRSRLWEWKDISRLDVVTYSRDIDIENSMIRVHHQYPGEISLDREDRAFDPELAQIVIERAGLKPAKETAGVDLANLPVGQDATYTWKK
jgi:hypothetical protein